MSDSPKRSLLDSPSPTREQKARQAVAEAAASVSASGAPAKWKMQIGNATSGSSRFKKKPEREDWEEQQDRRSMNKNGDLEEQTKKPPPQLSAEKNMSIRKAMAMKEPLPKKELEMPKKAKPLPPAPTTKPLITPGQVVLDKFGNFRLVTPPENKKRHDEDMPPLPPGAPPKGYAGMCLFLTTIRMF